MNSYAGISLEKFVFGRFESGAHSEVYETTRMNVLSQMFDRVVNTPL